MTLTYPRAVRIVEPENEFSHHYPVGTIVTLLSDDGDESDGGKYKAFQAMGENHEGRVIPQGIMLNDFEEIVPAQSEEQKEVAARIKYLYSVQDNEGNTLVNTRDREYAREVKAFMGGKKDGVIIMAYAPVKEIR